MISSGDRTEASIASGGDSKRQIILTSNDNHSFVVPLHNFLPSAVITDLIRACPTEHDGKPHVIPLPNVSGFILKKVIDWAEHHKEDPVPQVNEEDEGISKSRCDNIDPWDMEFFNLDQGAVFGILMTSANYLDMKALLETGAKVVANMIKGKTPEEIRRTFNIPCDFGEGEEEQIQKENDWCKE